MEPRQEGIPGGVERAPVSSGDYQTAPQLERFTSTGEKYQEQQEMGAVQAEAAQIAMPALPTPVISSPQQPTQGTVSDDTPIVANDDDLIEKEWVDKAKKILADTRDDPYKREKEISQLQIEYIRRRYGRQIGDSVD